MKTETPITLDQALAAVEKFDAIAFFLQVPAGVRATLAEALVRLVNRKCPNHTLECVCPREAFDGVRNTPVERLRLFTDAFIRINAPWSGLGEMEAIYCMMFPPGDGIERPSPVTPRYTFEDHDNGTAIRLLPAPEDDQLALPPGVEPMTAEERKAMIDGALAKVRGQLPEASTPHVGVVGQGGAA